MENRDRANDTEDVFKDSSGNGDEGNASAGAAAPEEFPTDLPSMGMLSASDSPPLASLPLTPATKVNDNDGRDVAHSRGTEKLEHAPLAQPPYASLPSASTSNDDNDRGLVHGNFTVTKVLEHAPPSEAMPSPGVRILEMALLVPEHFPHHHLVTLQQVGHLGLQLVLMIPPERSQMKNPSRKMMCRTWQLKVVCIQWKRNWHWMETRRERWWLPSPYMSE
jgi:hypothetical protein